MYQCFRQTAPLRQSRVALREGPQKNRERAKFSPLLLQGCMQAYPRRSISIAIPRLKIVFNMVANELKI